MIVNEKHLGRYVFIFDMNRLVPFDGAKYGGGEWRVLTMGGDASGLAMLREPRDWLRMKTTAFRMEVVTLRRHHFNPNQMDVNAIAVTVPESLAVLFRLFWFNR